MLCIWMGVLKPEIVASTFSVLLLLVSFHVALVRVELNLINGIVTVGRWDHRQGVWGSVPLCSLEKILLVRQMV